jgi:hypothetical protein
MELDEPTADVGLVQVRLPHQKWWSTSSRHYPGFHMSKQEEYVPDCRQSWLYTPAKCHRMFMYAKKKMYHPDLVSYPNFPGFTEPFLEWYFDIHDTDKNGELHYEEFRAAQSQQAIDGTYAMWERPWGHNVKHGSGYTDANARHIWLKLDVMHKDYGNESVDVTPRGDSRITKDEWVHGMLAQPQKTFCNLFDRTGKTHGNNLHNGEDAGCERQMDGPIAQHWGNFPDDGNHGFMVSVSDAPCTDKDGCPTGTNVSLCEYRNHHTDTLPASVNCKGAKGKYIQITLPGDGKRLLPTLYVTPHRATIPIPKTTPPTSRAEAINSTNPYMQMACYGVQPRAPPDADAVDLLAAAKLHPKTIVNDNPEDPIFWSTCYDRVIIKEWLPLLGAGGEDDTDNTTTGAAYVFNNGNYCLDCESVRLNYNTGSYDMAKMNTPRWWLQPKGQCENCDAVVFGIHTSTTTSTSNSTTTSASTSITATSFTSTTSTISTSTTSIISTSTTTVVTTAVSNVADKNGGGGGSGGGDGGGGGGGGDDSGGVDTTTITNTTKCAGLYCGDSEAELVAATITALRAAFAATGVDGSTVANILTEMQSTLDLAALATAAATDGLAAVLVSEKFASILTNAGLDDSAVAATAAAATAVEVEAVDRDSDEDAAAAEAKSNAGVVAGGVIVALGVVLLLVGGMMVYRNMHNMHNMQANAGADGGGGSAGAVVGSGTGSWHGSSDTSAYQGITLTHRKSSEAVVYQNPMFGGGEANDNTPANNNEMLDTDNGGWL